MLINAVVALVKVIVVAVSVVVAIVADSCKASWLFSVDDVFL